MNSKSPVVAVVGGGPAGLMAAETLAAAGARVHVYDAMASVGRKFLLAGRGGLNLTHSEPTEAFVERFGETRRAQVGRWLSVMGPGALREWAEGLGIGTFVGTSGRVFPADMKAAPLLRAWLHRLRASGVQFHMRHRWQGGLDGGAGAGALALTFDTPSGEAVQSADAVVLALGGGSWARLGSDGAWQPWLRDRGVETVPLVPANCGFDVGWTPFFAERFAGQPFKSVAIEATDSRGRHFARKKGEFVATATGVEGSLIYAASALLRDEIAAAGSAVVNIDLLPDRSPAQVREQVLHPRGARSVSSHLQSRLGLDGVKRALLNEVLGRDGMHDVEKLASAIKSLPLRVVAARPIDEAISSAGGVRLEALDEGLMAHALPGVFCAGEMLDWEAPTGGYLLTASMASGVVAARGALDWLKGGR
ncbi:TIGR03862 family flavoprotein [Variovorax sp.]|uniref:TIGR03862 family flavoprotein n=1 Tax=Variovorax sp. TaxID=1871043 RepID=UPI002D2ED617|nr:TIGR03862 family flavoprotein [Variovorax sp.]HYP85767.1 TIGR03862 family flavoprotein [Variovorax sp.]